MNSVQFAQQIKHILQQLRWPGGTQEVVFGTQPDAVVVLAENAVPGEDGPTGSPRAAVMIDTSTPDGSDPDVMSQRFAVLIAAEVAGDQFGEYSIIGGAAPDVGGSAGKGVGELAGIVTDALKRLRAADGVAVQLSGVAIGQPRTGDGTRSATIEAAFEAVCTTSPFYAPPQRLRWSVYAWRWDGRHCAARFDFLQYRLVRKYGTEPSVDPTDGDALYVGTEPKWVGQQDNGWTYTVFADYNSRGGTAVEGSSDPDVGAWRTP